MIINLISKTIHASALFLIDKCGLNCLVLIYCPGYPDLAAPVGIFAKNAKGIL